MDLYRAALVLCLLAIDIAVQHGSGGVGWFLSGAIIATLAFIPSALVAYRGLKLIAIRGIRTAYTGQR